MALFYIFPLFDPLFKTVLPSIFWQSGSTLHSLVYSSLVALQYPTLFQAIELPTLMACVYIMKFGRQRGQSFTLIMGAIVIFAAMAAINSKSPMVSSFIGYTRVFTSYFSWLSA